jgi:hypothetical protein
MKKSLEIDAVAELSMELLATLGYVVVKKCGLEYL